MAVLRANRLWAATAWPEVLASDGSPHPQAGYIENITPELPEPHAAGDVFICPQGKRAIIRTITSVVDGTFNAAVNPEVQYKVRAAEGATYWIVRGLWQLQESGGTHLIYSQAFRGMVVLNEGDTLNIRNAGAQFYCHTYGSGMLLNLQQ